MGLHRAEPLQPGTGRDRGECGRESATGYELGRQELISELASDVAPVTYFISTERWLRDVGGGCTWVRVKGLGL